jgi:hypothetical protein
MACYFGDNVLTSPAYTQITTDFYFAPPQDIRKYMTSKESAVRYADSTLSTLISYAKGIIAKGNAAFDFNQFQYVQDQLVHIQAIDKYLSEKYQTGILSEPTLSAKFNELVKFDGSGNITGGLFQELKKFNPDVGQLAYIQNVLAARKAAGQTVPANVQFVPQFSQDKTPIVVTPEAGIPGSAYPSPSDNESKKSSIGTILLVAVGAIVAFNAMKG